MEKIISKEVSVEIPRGFLVDFPRGQSIGSFTILKARHVRSEIKNALLCFEKNHHNRPYYDGIVCSDFPGGYRGDDLMVDLYAPDIDRSRNLQLIEKVLVHAALRANMEIREVQSIQISPEDLGCEVIVSESHLIMRSYPKKRISTVDIYTCGEKADPYRALNFIIRVFNPKFGHIQIVPRG